MDHALLPFVSVIIPCKNEANYIIGCLDSVVHGDYPAERFEILVVDGLSNDGTAELVTDYSRTQSQVKVLTNSRQTTPTALNLGIASARGSVIARIDAHARVAADYLTQCVRALNQFGAANVGGVMYTVPASQDAISRSVALSLSHPFGVGNSTFCTHSARVCEVDTVFGGCYPRTVFEKVGLYNEKLQRGQDMEFNLRVRRSGGRILFVPEIVSHYFARTSYKAFVRHNWTNGVWAILPFALSDIVPVRPRHLVPLAFVFMLLVLAALSTVSFYALWLLAAIAAAYLLACVAAAVTAGWKRRDLAAAVFLPAMFATLHLTYGLGSLAGAVRLVFQREFWMRISRGRARQ